MQRLLFFSFALTILHYFSVVNGTPWPEPDSIVAYWPFDAESGTVDVARNMAMSNTNNATLAAIDGPFGAPNTAYSVKCSFYCWIGYKAKLGLSPSFSISFYYYSKANGQGSIFMLWDLGAKLALSYRSPNLLEVWGGDAEDVYPGLIGQYPIFTPGSWNFFAITYDSVRGSLRIYDQTGTVRVLEQPVAIYVAPSAQIDVGHTVAGTNLVAMKTTDAIACLMLYKTVLSSPDIAKLPDVCRTKGEPRPTPGPTTPFQGKTTPSSAPTTGLLQTLSPMQYLTFVMLINILDKLFLWN